MKICIISPMKLPIPSKKGGAIETIIDQLIKENEVKKRIFIDCYSIPDEDGQRELYLSKHDRIIYIKNNKLQEHLQSFVNVCKKVIHRLTKNKLNITEFSYSKIAELAKYEGYDYIIFEAGSYSCARYFLKYYKKDQLVLHLHHTSKTSEYDDYFGRVICVSEYVKEQFLTKSNIDSKNIYVLKNVVDPYLFLKRINEDEKRRIKESLNITRNEKVLLFCGRIIKVKGIKETLLAIQKLENKNVKLIVIGSSNFGKKVITNFEKEIFSMIKRNSNVIYLGFVSNEELFKYYQIADIFVMPSNWEEAAGLVNLEAMLSGTPIITTRMGGIPEYVSEDECIFVENQQNFINNLKNAIDDLLNNYNKRQKLSENCLIRAKNITLEKYYEEFINIFLN